MSRLSELIEELCPEGVEYKKLGKVCDFQNGFAFRSTKFVSTGCPILRITNINNGAISTDNLVYFNKKDYKENLEQYKVRKGDIVIAMSGATTGKIGKSDVEDEFYLNQRAGKFIPRKGLDNGYLFHILLSQTNTFYNLALGGAQPNLSTASIKELQIPIPPLPVQEEIVRILDTFTALITELEAELEARKKQYEYYRNKLLTFDTSNKGENEKKVVWMTIKDIGKVCMCKRIMKNETTDMGDIPFYKIGTFGKEPDAYISNELYNEYKSKFSFPKKGDILLSASGTIGRTVIYDGKPAYFQDSNIVWVDNDEKLVLNKFLYYIYQITEWQTEGGTIKRLYNENLMKVKVPIPPLAEQQRIVSILDKFEKLTTDLTQGIPAEIEARRKQYEYYRDKLLTFKRKETVKA